MKKFKPALTRKEILEIVPHADFLTEVTQLDPGKSGAGIAFFPKDPEHFRDEPIVKASWLAQAVQEMGELVVRAHPKARSKKLKGMRADYRYRRSLPQGKAFLIVVKPEINPEYTRGRIEVKGYFIGNSVHEKLAMGGEFTFCLKEISVKN